MHRQSDMFYLSVKESFESGSCEFVANKCQAGHVCNFSTRGLTCTHYCKHEIHAMKCANDGICYYDDQLKKSQCRYLVNSLHLAMYVC